MLTNVAYAAVEIDRGKLIQCALDVQKNSYAPYSKFNVAAAVLCDSGKIYTGVNVEDASYNANVCAERNTIMREFSNPKKLLIIMARTPTDYVEKTLEELLPMSFDPESLK